MTLRGHPCHTRLPVQDPSRKSDNCEEDELEQGAPGYLHAEIRFEDGSRWKLTKALSEIKYQQGEPPFEARQVFECICIKDPNNTYAEIKEAVIKVKYQVQGTSESIFFFWDHARSCRSELAKNRNPQDDPEARYDVSHADQLYHDATNPVEDPHYYTIDEAKALQYFGKTECAHTPHLLDVCSDYVVDQGDEQVMPGGYAVFILMTKVPGEQLSYDTFWGKDEEEREAIRRAFKVALKEIWKLRINLHDRGIRNLIWNKEEEKCYIVDFEDYAVIDNPDPEAWWADFRYQSWGLSEECKDM